MNLSDLKTLLISAKNELNSSLNLNRSKKIRYEERQYFELVTFLSLWNAAGEDASKVMNVLDEIPSGDALMQQLHKFDFGMVEEQFETVFEKQFQKQFKNKKKKPKALAIIDIHEQETYTKEKRTSPDIRGGKHKNGTNFFFKFATIQIVCKNKILTLKVKIFRRQDSLRNLVKELVSYAQKFVKIKVLLLDRGFRDASLFNDLEFLEIPVLMPCIKDQKTRQEFEKANRNFQVVKYYWKNVKGEYADFKLLMIMLDNGKEVGFFTTMKAVWLHTAKYFLKLYAKRWNIETGYRLQKSFLPKTTCVKGTIRFFYFCYATAMHNLWNIIKNVVEKARFTVLAMKFMLIYFWITTHLNPGL